MKKIVLVLSILAALTAPAFADCEGKAPYYHSKSVEESPGSLIADVFFLPFTAAVTALTVPASAALQDWSVTKDASCVPVAQAERIYKVVKNPLR